MTGALIEIDFWISGRDRFLVLCEMARWSNKQKDGIFHFLSHPLVSAALNLFLAYLSYSWIMGDLPRLWSQGLQAEDIMTHLFGLFVTWLILRNLATILLPYMKWDSDGEGVHWGAHRMRATPEALTVSLSDCETVYRWTAILGIKKTKRMLLLVVTPYHAIVVPRSTFASKAEEESFCGFVEEHVAQGKTASQEETNGPGQ